jgi:DNA-binding NtrC family response regulator
MTRNILAIDDEPHMLRLLERIITEKTAYSIFTTSSPLEVPDLLEKNTYNLIITDLKMPGLDGLDILRLLKEKGRPEVVIIITAFGAMETAVEALSLGVFDYMTKPFRKEQILFTIERAMRCQLIKQESTRLSAIFEREPYDEARRSFEREYVHRLAQRVGSDRAAMARRSGLSVETIAATLKEEG